MSMRKKELATIILPPDGLPVEGGYNGLLYKSNERG
jgi:hypothetical protein